MKAPVPAPAPSGSPLPPGFIPSRHGARRDQARTLLGALRLVVRGDAEPTPERWREIGEALMHGDQPMDRLVAWMYGIGMAQAQPLFEQALERGIDSVQDAPAPLRDFFALVDRRPDWVDMHQVAEGAKVTDRGGLDYFFVDRDLALMGGYQASAFNKTLLLTGALEKGPVRRVAETAQWFLDCADPGGMERFGIGFKSTLRVRLIHGLVRRHVPRLPQWRMTEWGLPVNQIDMAATALAFPMLMLLGGRAFGILPTRRESRAAMHFGRYVGWLMGVDERWLPWTEAEARKLLYEFSLSITNPDETSVQLASALMDEPLHRPYKRLPWLQARYQKARHLSVSSLFISRAARRGLGLPTSSLPWYPLLRLPWNLLRHSLARIVPGGQVWLARRGRRSVVAFLQSMTGDERQRIGHSARQLTGDAAPH
jgi:hypothetical protein